MSFPAPAKAAGRHVNRANDFRLESADNGGAIDSASATRRSYQQVNMGAKLNIACKAFCILSFKQQKAAPLNGGFASACVATREFWWFAAVELEPRIT